MAVNKPLHVVQDKIEANLYKREDHIFVYIQYKEKCIVLLMHKHKKTRKEIDLKNRSKPPLYQSSCTLKVLSSEN